ncbi:uncharacterized protein RJT20DRAFT_133703 [Scheffersomyces xylosifermentans]|uniref:uncharacterized protein n=1 Tax=Scheffersomyces xylosifermentans TaxID=1304137 RepID=UPI00315D1200
MDNPEEDNQREEHQGSSKGQKVEDSIRQAGISDQSYEEEDNWDNASTKRTVDATFGQYAAFPTTEYGSDRDDDDESIAVASYLKSVRSEAENDQSVYYVKRGEESDIISKENNSTTNDIHNQVQVGPEVVVNPAISKTDSDESLGIWSANLLEEFLNVKERVHALQAEILSSPVAQVEVPETASQWRKYVVENDPPSMVFFYKNIDRPTVIKLLVYFTKWLSVSTTATLSKWIWSVLLRIDNLLDPNESSVVRDLGKKALKLAIKIQETDPQNDSSTLAAKYTINMVLVLVGNYYGQKDLLKQTYL